MNETKMMTIAISHYMIGGLFLIFGLVFTGFGIPFYYTWSILAYGVLLIIFGVFCHKVRNKIVAIVQLVLFMAICAFTPVTSAIVIFAVIAILLALMHMLFLLLARKQPEAIVLNQAEAGEATDTTANPTENTVENTVENAVENKDAADYANLDFNDFEIDLYDGGETKVGKSKISVSPYGITLSENEDYSESPDLKSMSYVLDEVNTTKFLKCLNTTDEERINTIAKEFSGKDSVEKFKAFCDKNAIVYESLQ